MATLFGGCRQTLMPDRAVALPGADPSLPDRSSSAARLDATARQFRMALLHLALPLAAAARTFSGCHGWKAFGYARLSDHARERLDRSARWVRDHAALSEAAEQLPGLASALTGEDGGRPLGLEAARCLGKVASRDSLATWLSIARTHTVREFKALTRHAATTGSHWPEAEQDSPAQGLLPEDETHQRVCLFVPAAAREAFAESLELYRAVEGHTAGVGEFVDSLVAEATCGALAGKVDLAGPRDEISKSQKNETARHGSLRDAPAKTPDTSPPRPRSGWCSSPEAPADTLAQEAIFRTRARRWLQEVLGNALEECDDKAFPPEPTTGATSTATPSPAVIADARMRRLLSLHDEIERQLAEVVTRMADTDAWRALGYAGLDDYARRGLGWSRSTLYSRIQLVRRLRRLPVLRQAYQQGHIGRVAAQTIARMLTGEAAAGTIPIRVPAATQQAWVERAAASTVKRLQDETRAVARLLVMRAGDSEPLDDLNWHASLHRQAGTAQRRVQTLTGLALAAPAPLLTLRLVLRNETAMAFRRTLAAARRDPGLVQTFAATRGGVPEWAALLALLQEFIETWDVDLAGRRPSVQRIYIRDGWRCMAPGCTSRRNLEIHHVMYRSQGGVHQPRNLLCLCRFHHQMGEHGLLAQVRGEAPLGLVWRLGRDGRGGRFRNELRLID